MMVNENLTYISDEFVFDRCLFESTVPEKSNGILRIIKGPIAEWDILNRNKRMYTERLWDGVLASPYVKEQLKYKTLYGEANHPTDRYEVDFSRVSHSIVDMWKVPSNNQIHGTIQILDTPLGRILNTLYEAGGVLGYSTRAGGSLTKKKDYTEVDEKNYNFITLDAVPYPSVASARPGINEGTEINKVELSDECHETLIRIIKESPEKDKEVIKDLIYSLQSYDLQREKSLFEEVSHNMLKEGNSVDETTMFLLKESSNQIDILKSERSTLKAAVDGLKKENLELKGSLDSSLRKIENLVSESKRGMDSTASSNSLYENTIRSLKKEIERLVSESEDRELEYARYDNIYEAFKAVQIENDCLKRDIVDAESQVKDGYMSDLESCRVELKESNEELVNAVNEINVLSGVINQLNLEKESIRNESIVLEKRMFEMEDILKDYESKLNEGLELKNSKLESFDSEKRGLMGEIDRLNRLVSEFRENEDQIEERYSSVKRDLISVICSGYGLTVEEVSKRLPVGFGKSDVYYVCESIHNGDKRGSEFVQVIESVSRKSAVDVDSSVKKGILDFGLGANRRGLGNI